MKQIKILGVLAIALTLGLAACNGGGNDDGKSQETQTSHKHSWGEWTVTKPATCTEDGEQERSCACGEKQTKTIKAAHTWGEWQVVTPADCQTEGLEKRVCSVCNTEATRTIAKTDHTFVKDETATDVAPTCTETGTENLVCSVCGEKQVNTLPANGHTWGEWEITKEATCDTAGSQKHVCSVCNTEESEEIAALGHELKLIGGEITPPAGEAAVRLYECERCHLQYLGFKADEPSEASKSHLVEGDNGGMRFWGRPIGNALALNENGDSVNQQNNECVYCSTETGDFFEYVFTLTKEQAETLSTCRLYCDARPANYLSGDFWAYNRSADDWTPGYYIDGAEGHYEVGEDNQPVMVKDHARATEVGVAGEELETEVKMGARIEDYRYILYVDGNPVDFDAETEVPVKGNGGNMQRAEYVLPYTFHLHEGKNTISLRMAGGYRSEFYNFIFRPYVEPTPLDVTTEKIEIRQGQTAKIENTALTGLIYTSENNNIASVDENGVVTGVGVGSTTITVTKEGNYKKVKIPVTINEKFGVVKFEAEVEGFVSDPADAVKAGNIAQWGTTMGIAEFAKDATYTVKFNGEKAGKFDLTFTGFGTIEDLAAAMSVKVNGADVTVSGSLNTSWRAATVTFGQADLVVGENTLVIKALGETMPKFDSFRFVPVEEAPEHEHAWVVGEKAADSALRALSCTCDVKGYELQAADLTSGHKTPDPSNKSTRLGKGEFDDVWNITGIKAGTYDVYLQARASAGNANKGYWNSAAAVAAGDTEGNNGGAELSKEYKYKVKVGDGEYVNLGDATSTYAGYGLTENSNEWTNKALATITVAEGATSITIHNMNNGYSIWVFGLRLIQVAA